MHKFKVGDIVRLINAHGMGASEGATAVVQGYSHYDSVEYLELVWIKNSLCGCQMDGGYDEDNFILESEYKRPAPKIYDIVKFLEGIKT